jgi:hypothetical protein
MYIDHRVVRYIPLGGVIVLARFRFCSCLCYMKKHLYGTFSIIQRCDLHKLFSPPAETPEMLLNSTYSSRREAHHLFPNCHR